MVPVSPGSYLIASFRSSKVVDVPGHSMANNTQIVQWNYNGGANQHWKIGSVLGWRQAGASTMESIQWLWAVTWVGSAQWSVRS